MADEYAYYMMANSGMDIGDDLYTYKENLADLRKYIKDGGRIVEIEEVGLDLPQWLNDEKIPHHFEWIVFHSGPHTVDTLFVIHVYEWRQAFDIRMMTNHKPMKEGWRDKWLAKGFDACRSRELP